LDAAWWKSKNSMSGRDIKQVIDKSQYFMMGLVNLWILGGNRTLENSQVALNNHRWQVMIQIFAHLDAADDVLAIYSSQCVRASPP